MTNLKALLETLLENKIDFVLIGGFAGVLHGSSQVTQDIDICAAISQETLQSLRAALKNLNPKHRMNPNYKPSFIDVPKTAEGVKNLYLETDLGVLDILSEVPPVGDFDLIKQHALEIQLYGHLCKVISLDHLIKVKESMKRLKDLQTLHELKLIKKSKL